MGLEENKEETKSNKMKKSELKEMIRAAFLNEVEEEEVEVDTEVEDEAGDEIDVDASAEEEVGVEMDQEAGEGISGDKKSVQDSLEAALQGARALGDEKLADQIGNSITFFTRTHVVGQDQVAEEGLNEETNRMQKLAGIKK